MEFNELKASLKNTKKKIWKKKEKEKQVLRLISFGVDDSQQRLSMAMTASCCTLLNLLDLESTHPDPISSSVRSETDEGAADIG